MEILSASLHDLIPLRHIEQTCFPGDAWPLIDLLAVLTWPNVVRLKMVDSGRMIGFVAGDPRPSEHLAWIATIAVLPLYQRQGIGRMLMLACEERLPQDRIRLCVRTTNQAAICMYQQLGYLPIETWKGYYNDNADALVMEKQRTPLVVAGELT